MTECGECVRLERLKAQARAEGDHSKVSDCNVLLKEHPNHRSPEPSEPSEPGRPRKVRS